MPLVSVPKKRTISSLKIRTKIVLFSLLISLIALSGFAGWQIYGKHQLSLEKRAYETAMSQANDFSKRSQPQLAAGVLERYLKSTRPLNYRYQAMSTLAYSYIQDHQDQKAFTALKQADELNVKPPSIYVLRSLAYYSLMHHDKSAALSYYRRAVVVAESKYDPEATPYIAGWKKQIQELESSL